MLFDKVMINNNDYNIVNHKNYGLYEDVLYEDEEIIEIGDCQFVEKCLLCDFKNEEYEKSAVIEYMRFNDKDVLFSDFTYYDADDVSASYADGVKIARYLWNKERKNSEEIIVVTGFYINKDFPLLDVLKCMLNSVATTEAYSYAVNVTPYLNEHLEYGVFEKDIKERNEIYEEVCKMMKENGFKDVPSKVTDYEISRYMY